MVEIADIGDKESLETWLEDKPRELAILLAHRAAARVLPLYWEWCADRSTVGDLTEIALWRILPTSRVGAVYATRAVENAADAAKAFRDTDLAFAIGARPLAANLALAAAAAACTDDAAPAVSHAADASSSAALAAAVDAVARPLIATLSISRNADNAANVPAARAEIWKEVRRDAADYLGTDMRAARPLWEGGKPGMPAKIAKAWEATRTALTSRIEAGDTGWQFWIDWYEAQLTGADQNWEMLKKIVLIPDDDWKQGAARVNGLIEGIVAEYRGNASLTLSGRAEMRDDADFDADHVPRQPLAQMLNRNAKTIRLQLDTLASLLRDEIDGLRGRNDLSDEERDEAQRRIDILNRILSRVEAMAGEFSEGQASENALTVVEENLPALPEEAAELAEAGGDPAVSDLVISMGASIEHLTKRGAPGSLATGIAAFDHLWGSVKRWWNKNREDRP